MVFHSRRERGLWAWTTLLVLAIYATLPVARRLTEYVRGQGWLRVVVSLCLLAAVVAFGAWMVRQRPGWRRALGLIPVLAAYAFVLTKAYLPEERLHLIEYGGVGILAFAALRERRRARLDAGLPAGWLARWPASTAIVLAAAAGWLDEGIQHLLPSRVYDLRDVGFNAAAAALAVAAVWLCSRSSATDG